MTPPLDEEEENEESRLLEAQARKELENDGCSPCYPPDLEVPLRDPPGKYRSIIGYWQSFPGTGDVVLRAQLSGWRKFRMSQPRVRHRFRNKPFSEYVDEVRERRQRHQLGRDVSLQLDPKQQSLLENWVEFQNYHLRGLERFREKQERLRKELDDIQRTTGGADTAASERAVRQFLQNVERDLKRHKVLLQWIEQERRAIDPEYQTPIQEDEDNHAAVLKTLQRSSTHDTRTRKPTSMILGNVRVSKVTPKKQNTYMQKLKASGIKPAIHAQDAILQGSIPQAPERRDTESRCIKETTPLRQLIRRKSPKGNDSTEPAWNHCVGHNAISLGKLDPQTGHDLSAFQLHSGHNQQLEQS